MVYVSVVPANPVPLVLTVLTIPLPSNPFWPSVPFRTLNPLVVASEYVIVYVSISPACPVPFVLVTLTIPFPSTPGPGLGPWP